ncbi:unnamed protein product, partial [Musa textilis]
MIDPFQREQLPGSCEGPCGSKLWEPTLAQYLMYQVVSCVSLPIVGSSVRRCFVASARGGAPPIPDALPPISSPVSLQERRSERAALVFC